MIAEISSQAFDSFFGWAPWVVGAAIYGVFYVAKRHDSHSTATASARATYSCALCGRRGSLDQMVAQDHGGAIGYQCVNCATVPQAVAHL